MPPTTRRSWVRQELARALQVEDDRIAEEILARDLGMLVGEASKMAVDHAL
jgi:hypothetical protein